MSLLKDDSKSPESMRYTWRQEPVHNRLNAVANSVAYIRNIIVETNKIEDAKQEHRHEQFDNVKRVSSSLLGKEGLFKGPWDNYRSHVAAMNFVTPNIPLQPQTTIDNQNKFFNQDNFNPKFFDAVPGDPVETELQAIIDTANNAALTTGQSNEYLTEVTQ